MNIQIPGYEIIRVLGEGGMGVVYLAKDENLEVLMAIKLLHRQYTSKEKLIERFKNEARMMSTLVHSNIVQFRQFITLPEGLALVMEFVDGRGLDLVIGEETGPIPWEKALPMFKQVLEGVGYAHSKKIVHRDIKPSNIIVTGTGEVKVTDFGIAKAAGQSSLTKTGMQMGTLYYESPEQIRGAKNVDERSDIYSLGMTLYEMLAGRLPFDSSGGMSEFDITQQIVFKDIVPPDTIYPHIPGWLVNVVSKAIEKKPEDRFQSCSEFLEALKSMSCSPVQKTSIEQPEQIPNTYSRSEVKQFDNKKKIVVPVVIGVVFIAVALVLILTNPFAYSSSITSENAVFVRDEEVSSANTSGPTETYEEVEELEEVYEEPFDPVNTIRPEVVSELAYEGRSRAIRNHELDDLSYREIKLLRNYFFAFYNRPFNTAWIRNYFEDNMSGYRGNGSSDPNLSSTERGNVTRIIDYESDNNIPSITH